MKHTNIYDSNHYYRNCNTEDWKYCCISTDDHGIRWIDGLKRGDEIYSELFTRWLDKNPNVELMQVPSAEELQELYKIKEAYDKQTNLTEDDVDWVVNSMGELGVEIHGQCFFCYKGNSFCYVESGEEEKDDRIRVRNIGKREFGETVWPLLWMKQGYSEFPYNVECQYIEGLSYGLPNNPKYKWLTLKEREKIKKCKTQITKL